MNENVKLRINDLSVFYGGFRALREVSVDIPARQITSIIGPSGCGKSTFLRSFNRMNDLIQATHVEGEVLLDGHDLYDFRRGGPAPAGGHGVPAAESVPQDHL